MDHVAILRKAKISKNDNLLADILSGTKTIESRWYINKVAPWNKVGSGDTIYFKESGHPITVKATVNQVLQYSDLKPVVISNIISEYGSKIAPSLPLVDFYSWGEKQVKKRYCILIFIENVTPIEPFNIDKKGYGILSAWLCVENINRIKI